MTVAQARAVIERARDFQPEPPRPLTRELPPAEPFPIEALGHVLGGAARAIHEQVQAPAAIGAQSVLAVTTLAVQGHADVELPTGERKPVSGFFMSIGQSGERKTACDGKACWPVRKREAALKERFEVEHERWQNDEAAWKVQRQQILANKKRYPDRDAKRNALDELGPAPTPPPSPMLTCPEPTFEGLCRLLANGEPSIGVFSGEGGQFIAGHGMSEDNRIKTAAAFSSLWDGEPVKRVRAGDGVAILPRRRVCMHLMAQPGVAALLLSDPDLSDQGLLSRFLVTAPDSAAGTRFWRDPTPESDAALRRYGARLLDILETPAPRVEGRPSELAPRVLPLSPEARRAWIAFADHVERQVGSEGAMEPIRGLANKLPEHAARLAAVLALVEDLEAGEVGGEHIEAGIALAQHYAAEALRLYEAGRIDGDLRLAQRLLDWLLRTWREPLVSLPDVYQRGPGAIRDQSSAAKLVGILEHHGWLAKVDGGAVVAGHKRRDAWRIVRG